MPYGLIFLCGTQVSEYFWDRCKCPVSDMCKHEQVKIKGPAADPLKGTNEAQTEV